MEERKYSGGEVLRHSSVGEFTTRRSATFGANTTAEKMLELQEQEIEFAQRRAQLEGKREYDSVTARFTLMKECQGMEQRREHEAGNAQQEQGAHVALAQARDKDCEKKRPGNGGVCDGNYEEDTMRATEDLMEEYEVFNEGAMRKISSPVHGRSGSDRAPDLGQASNCPQTKHIMRSYGGGKPFEAFKDKDDIMFMDGNYEVLMNENKDRQSGVEDLIDMHACKIASGMEEREYEDDVSIDICRDGGLSYHYAASWQSFVVESMLVNIMRTKEKNNI